MRYSQWGKKNSKENLAEGKLVHVATAASQTELQMLNARGVKNALPSDFLFGKTRGTERQVQRNHFLTLWFSFMVIPCILHHLKFSLWNQKHGPLLVGRAITLFHTQPWTIVLHQHSPLRHPSLPSITWVTGTTGSRTSLYSTPTIWHIWHWDQQAQKQEPKTLRWNNPPDQDQPHEQ